MRSMGARPFFAKVQALMLLPGRVARRRAPAGLALHAFSWDGRCHLQQVTCSAATGWHPLSHATHATWRARWFGVWGPAASTSPSGSSTSSRDARPTRLCRHAGTCGGGTAICIEIACPNAIRPGRPQPRLPPAAHTCRVAWQRGWGRGVAPRPLPLLARVRAPSGRQPAVASCTIAFIIQLACHGEGCL